MRDSVGKFTEPDEFAAVLNPDEFMVVWEALTQYVEGVREAIEYGDATNLDEKLAVAERVLARFDAVVAAVGDEPATEVSP
jgi:hypothetical protein